MQEGQVAEEMANEGGKEENVNIFKPLEQLMSTNGHAKAAERFEKVYLVRDCDTMAERKGPGVLTLTDTEAIWKATGEAEIAIELRMQFAEVNLHAIGTHNDKEGDSANHGNRADVDDVAERDDAEQNDGERDDTERDEAERDEDGAGGSGEGYMLVQLGDDCTEVRLIGMDDESLHAIYTAFCEAVCRCAGEESESDGYDDRAGESEQKAVLAGLDALITTDDDERDEDEDARWVDAEE